MFPLRSAVFLIISLHVTFTVQDPLHVSVYYESLCPDSVRFIANQLHPAFEIISDKLDIDFVPYGKATHEYVDGKWQFECQHGPRECYGNIMQACALNETADATKREGFVHCVMASSNAANDAVIKNCLDLQGISWDNVRECGTTSTGDELLVQYGDQTHNVDPLITFVPTIIFNGKYNSTLQSSALADFLYTACSLLDTKPTVCPAQMKRNYRLFGHSFHF